MKRPGRGLLAALLLAALLLSLFPAAALAAEAAEAEAPAEPPEGMWDVRVYVDGLLSGRALGGDTGVWLAAEDLCVLLGFTPSCFWDEEQGELSIGGPHFVLHAVAGLPYFSANSRWLYEPRGFFRHDGLSWFPADVIDRVFGGNLRVSSDGTRVDLDSELLGAMPGGAAWYYDNYGSSEIFWLARIIHAEAGGQPVEGKIGVGNVVLNRVESDRFPDNIQDVVFDTQFAVQFQPIMNGSVFGEPNEEDVICACLCFEGYNTVGESMFFVNPDRADDSWFRSTKDFVVTIGDHDFYKLRG